MKKLLIILLLGSTGLVSCNSWLDVQPKTSIKEEKLFQSEYGFKDVLTGFYIKMGSEQLYARQLTYNYLDQLAMLYDFAPGIINWESIYNYEGSDRSTIDNYFTQMYNIIANINNFLYYVDKNRSVLTTPHYYEIMKGEALGLRAFLHFDLLRLYGPVYALNPQAKAIPYRAEFNNVVSAALSCNPNFRRS